MTDPKAQMNTQALKFSFYEGFDGKYHKVGEIQELIPQFKAFYYSEKRKEAGRSAIRIINDFNKEITPFTFFPWEKQYRLWRKKWDAELLAEQGLREEQRKMRQIIKVRDEQNALVVPDEYALETGAHTLAGELLNDAMDILKRDQESEDTYRDDIIVKRRNYVLNVFNYVMKASHSKEALNLKANADKRETAGFMMTILNRATAGKLTEEDFELLRASTPSADASPSIPSSILS